jgi:hypothetical protein
MPIEWLGPSKLVPTASTAAKSIYDRIIGKAPRLNFDADSGGVEMHVHNTREETIVIESIEAIPPILGFSTGEEIIDLVRAVVAQRGHCVEEPIAILSPSDKVSIKVITFDPFEDTDGAENIKVLVRWRSIKRGAFSRSSVSSKIQVRDIRDLKLAVERKNSTNSFRLTGRNKTSQA